MVSKQIILILAMSLTGAAQGSWASDWWNNVYKQRIKTEQYDAVRAQEQNKCDGKIKWYADLVKAKPNSEYNIYKLEEWQKKCK